MEVGYVDEFVNVEKRLGLGSQTDQMSIWFPGNESYGYNAKEGIFIECLGFIHHGVIIVGKGWHRELDNKS